MAGGARVRGFSGMAQTVRHQSLGAQRHESLCHGDRADASADEYYDEWGSSSVARNWRLGRRVVRRWWRLGRFRGGGNGGWGGDGGLDANGAHHAVVFML